MDIDIQHAVFAGSTILLATLVIIYVKPQARSRYKSPPGPRGLPILGNVLQVPRQVNFNRIIDYRRLQLELPFSTWEDTFEDCTVPTEDSYH